MPSKNENSSNAEDSVDPSPAASKPCLIAEALKLGRFYAECEQERAEADLAHEEADEIAKDFAKFDEALQLLSADALLTADMLAALQSAAASIEQLVKLNRIPANNKGLRDARAAIAKAGA